MPSGSFTAIIDARITKIVSPKATDPDATLTCSLIDIDNSSIGTIKRQKGGVTTENHH